MSDNISEAAQIKIVQLIAKELGVGPHQVAAAVALLTKVRPCPASRAIVRRPPATWTTRTCVIWMNACSICANWKNGAR